MHGLLTQRYGRALLSGASSSLTWAPRPVWRANRSVTHNAPRHLHFLTAQCACTPLQLAHILGVATPRHRAPAAGVPTSHLCVAPTRFCSPHPLPSAPFPVGRHRAGRPGQAGAHRQLPVPRQLRRFGQQGGLRCGGEAGQELRRTVGGPRRFQAHRRSKTAMHCGTGPQCCPVCASPGF